MASPKSLLKPAVSSVLAFVGNLIPTRKLPVLLYHSIDETDSPISEFASRFEKQLDFLDRAGYRTITVHDLVTLRAAGADLEDRTVILTFDDGFRSNYLEAFPLLKKYGFTATIYLTTNHIGGSSDWEMDGRIPVMPLMSWDEIREMSEYGIDFGSHTCSHPHLPRLNGKELMDELAISKAAIEDKLKKEASSLAHPYCDFSSETIQMVIRSGYRAAFGAVDFRLQSAERDLFNLTRIGSGHFDSVQDFKAGITGMYDLYIRIRWLLGKDLSRDY